MPIRRFHIRVLFEDNFSFVSNLLYEEKTLRQLRLTIGDGWKIAGSIMGRGRLDWTRLRRIVAIVLESGARIDYAGAKSRLKDSIGLGRNDNLHLRLEAMPGSKITPQGEDWLMCDPVPQTTWDEVTETVVWERTSIDHDWKVVFVRFLFEAESLQRAAGSST